ncbi:MAG TPA: hypothetical protein VE978_03960 [Chitinophagales bacterium]|nr:hypothetical protein [Chitinophagales bacterium]
MLIISRTTDAQESTAKDLVNNYSSITKTFLQAIRTKDTIAFKKIFRSDAQWSQPGSNRISGIKKNANEIIQMFSRISELSATTFSIDTNWTIAFNGNDVSCFVNITAVQPIGRILSVTNIYFLTIKDSLVTSVKVFTSDINKENEFWGSK